MIIDLILEQLVKSVMVVQRCLSGFLCVLLQAPLTSRDTAILSGSLSTHNGNGGGTINVAFRRVTSAKGWGEVRRILTGISF